MSPNRIVLLFLPIDFWKWTLEFKVSKRPSSDYGQGRMLAGEELLSDYFKVS